MITNCYYIRLGCDINLSLLNLVDSYMNLIDSILFNRLGFEWLWFNVIHVVYKEEWWILLKKYIEYDRLLNLIVGKGELLNEWEYKFSKDMLSKISKGQGLSDKMLDKIKNIWERIGEKEIKFKFDK